MRERERLDITEDEIDREVERKRERKVAQGTATSWSLL